MAGCVEGTRRALVLGLVLIAGTAIRAGSFRRSPTLLTYPLHPRVGHELIFRHRHKPTCLPRSYILRLFFLAFGGIVRARPHSTPQHWQIIRDLIIISMLHINYFRCKKTFYCNSRPAYLLQVLIQPVIV